MRRALARLLGVVFTLVLTSAAALAALAHLTRAEADGARPLFFNTQPRNVHDLAKAAVERLAHASDPRASDTLVRLGGAALPYVLPELERLPPEACERIALALKPLAHRMGLANEEELSTPDGAVDFWVQFWRDRAFDFRPQVVRRLVGRLSERSSALRYDDLIQLDTYAIGELVNALGQVRSPEDALRAERLTRVLSHVTGRGPQITHDLPLSEVRVRVRAWRHFWAEHGADYTALDGPLRVTAMLTQTRYGAWFSDWVRTLGVASNNLRALLGLPPQAAARSLARFLLSLSLSLALGASGALFELQAITRTRSLLRMLSIALVSAPVASIAFALAAGAPFASELCATTLSGLVGAAVVSRATLAVLSQSTRATRVSFGRALRVALLVLPGALGWLLTALFTSELAFRLDGVAPHVLDGLDEGRLEAGMSCALCAALLAILTVALGSRVERAPRSSIEAPALVEVDAKPARWTLWAALASWALLAWTLGFANRTGVTWLGWANLNVSALELFVYGIATLTVTCVLGVLLAAFATSGPASADSLLIRLIELDLALPPVFWAAALSRAFGSGMLLALSLGCLRAIDVAWLLRNELHRRGRPDRTRSLGRLPLRVYFRSQLGPALPAALVGLALTPAWCLALGAAVRFSGLLSPAPAGLASSVRAHTPPALAPGLVAFGLSCALTWLLLASSRSAERRVGAARSLVSAARRALETEG